MGQSWKARPKTRLPLTCVGGTRGSKGFPTCVSPTSLPRGHPVLTPSFDPLCHTAGCLLTSPRGRGEHVGGLSSSRKWAQGGGPHREVLCGQGILGCRVWSAKGHRHGCGTPCTMGRSTAGGVAMEQRGTPLPGYRGRSYEIMMETQFETRERQGEFKEAA